MQKLDSLTGIGGIPLRRITEISGYYSLGKTTLALQIVRQAQLQDIPCTWVDTEWSWDERYASQLGVDIDSMDLIQEAVAEDALDAAESALSAKKTQLVVLDSVGGLLPRQEAEKNADGKMIGGQAKMVATFCRKAVPMLAMNNIALIVLNHEFTDIMSGALKTSGGMKLEYHKSLWIRLKKANKRVMQGDKQVGQIINAQIRKNKLAATMMQETELTMIFGQGFSQEADLLQALLDSGEVKRVGNTFWRGDLKLGVGMTKAREALKV